MRVFKASDGVKNQYSLFSQKTFCVILPKTFEGTQTYMPYKPTANSTIPSAQSILIAQPCQPLSLFASRMTDND